jgi:cobalamin biosynthesis protein CobT
MAIGDVRPQDLSEQPQGHSPSDTTPLAQALDQNHEENQDELEGEDEHHDQVQEESNDQEGD